MPNLALASSSNEDITIIPLLCIGGESSRMGTRKELLPFSDGLLAFEHALITIHDAIPGASTIYLSLRDEAQLEGIRFRLEIPLRRPASQYIPEDEPESHENHHESAFPTLKPIFDMQEHGDIGPAAGLLAAHAALPSATLLVLGCDYPLLPPTALQQLILEYKPPLTCFVNAEGFTEPLIAIWSPEALDVLERNVKEGRSGLNRVVAMMEGVKAIKPLREAWIMGCNTRGEWDEAMQVLKERDG
jgi:molybdopterin-guanine dinucleotide biosynthesis protein A